MVRAFAGDSTITSRLRPSPTEPPALEATAGDQHAAGGPATRPPRHRRRGTTAGTGRGRQAAVRAPCPVHSTRRGILRVPCGIAALFRKAGGTARRTAQNEGNGGVLLPCPLPAARHPEGRRAANPDGSRRVRLLGAGPPAAECRRQQEGYPAAADHPPGAYAQVTPPA